MSNWMKVDQDMVNAPLDDSMVGIDLKLFVSPYDIPIALKGDYNESISKFVIELEYDSPDEELAAPDVADHITFYSGLHSGRLHKIELDVDKANAGTVELQIIADKIGSAITRLRTSQPKKYPRKRNYVAAQRAISQLPALAGAN